MKKITILLMVLLLGLSACNVKIDSDDFGELVKDKTIQREITENVEKELEENFVIPKEFSFDIEHGYKITTEDFSVTDHFKAEKLEEYSMECEINNSLAYYENLLLKFKDTTGHLYKVQYGKPSQDSGEWLIRVIPNKVGYKNMDEFQKDFIRCHAGPELPVLMNDQYLLLTQSGSGGVDDGSGLPHGLQILQDELRGHIVLKGGNTEEENSRYWSIYSKDYTIRIITKEGSPFDHQYKVCLKDDLSRCARIIQYDGTYKEYLMKNYIYVASQSDYSPDKRELFEIETSVPFDVTEIKTDRKNWKHGFSYYELEQFFHESSKGVIVISYDYAKGTGFLRKDVEELIKYIDYK